MGAWGLALALLLPWLTGALWVRRLWGPPRAAGSWPLILGYGYLLGMLGVALLLGLAGALGLRGGLALLLSPLLILTLLAALALRRLRRPSSTTPGSAPETPAPHPASWHWTHLLAGLLLLWLAIRLTGLILEVWWQPLFPWDAWTTWAPRARVWSELGWLVPFVAPDAWLTAPGGSGYTIDAWRYPPTVSLLALWPTLGWGAWNETAANLPWIGALLALGLGFYGQARLWGASAPTALVFLWLLGSLPLLNTHVALAGYADLWLASCFGLGTIALLHWLRDGDRLQGLLALLLLAACPFIKLEGLVWVLLVPAALLAARLHPRWWLVLIGAGLLVGALWWFGGGPRLIDAPFLGRFELGWHDSGSAILASLFVLDNWHLLGYLLVLALGRALLDLWRYDSAPWQRGAFVLVVKSLAVLGVLFFLTDAARWATTHASFNRLLLHFVPLLIFWMLTLWQTDRTRP